MHTVQERMLVELLFLTPSWIFVASLDWSSLDVRFTVTRNVISVKQELLIKRFEKRLETLNL